MIMFNEATRNQSSTIVFPRMAKLSGPVQRDSIKVAVLRPRLVAVSMSSENQAPYPIQDQDYPYDDTSELENGDLVALLSHAS